MDEKHTDANLETRFLALTIDQSGMQLTVRDYGDNDEEAQQLALQDLSNAMAVVKTQWLDIFNAHDESTVLSLDDLMDMEAKIKYQMDVLLEDLQEVARRKAEYKIVK